MPTANGPWVAVLDGSGWERHCMEDGILHRQFKGVDDDLIAKQAEHMRHDISKGKNPDGGNMAFHMPSWLLSALEARYKLPEMPMADRTQWWKRWGKTQTGQRYMVRGV